MQVTLKTDGGFVYLPGLNRTTVIDTASLPHDKAVELHDLVAAADFFDLPVEIGAVRPGAADYHRYTITVEDNGKRHTVETVDPIEDDEIAELVRFIQSVQPAQNQ